MFKPHEQLLSDLVSIDSINPELATGGVGEQAMAEYVSAWLTDHGVANYMHTVVPNRSNVIAKVPGTGGGKTLLLNGHMDTVGVSGYKNPHLPRIENGRMYGRGAYDMKCGVAACMLAMVEIAALRLRGDVIFTAVVDEEFAGAGTMDVAKRIHADAAIVTEPTELNLVIAHKGFVWADIEVHGRAAHGSRPQLGIDANAKLGHVLVAIEKLDHQMRVNPTHPLLGSGTIHSSKVHGGTELSSIAGSALVQIERRTIPGETVAFVTQELQALLDECAQHDPEFSATLRTTLALEPLETNVDEPIVQLILKHGAGVLGAKPEVTGVSFWTDAASLAHAPLIVGGPGWTDAASLDQVGITSVLFGPRGAGAHSTDEWVELESVRQCIEIYVAVAREYCA